MGEALIVRKGSGKKKGINPSELGFTKYAVDDIIFSSDTASSNQMSISHSLGEIPKMAIIIAPTGVHNITISTSYIHRGCFIIKRKSAVLSNTNTVGFMYVYHNAGNESIQSTGNAGSPSDDSLKTSITFKDGLGAKFKAGVTYKLLTFA